MELRKSAIGKKPPWALNESMDAHNNMEKVVNTPENREASACPLLSIVVIGRNEGARLHRCLQSISSIDYLSPKPELIYVDSGSTDGSPEVARSFGAQVIVLNAARPTAALGRNAGWPLAKGKFILFLDGDTMLHADFPRRAMETISLDPAIAAVWGNLKEIHPEASIYNRILDLDWIYPPGETEFCGGNVLMRKQAIEACGGYDAGLIAGEEPELCRRMRAAGYRIIHIDAPMAGHDLGMKHFSQYWKRSVRSGHAYAEVSRRFRETDDPFWQAEHKRSLIRGIFWTASICLAMILTAAARSVTPLLLWIVLLLLASLRSAWNARWKSSRMSLLILYGMHSQLQQIPICLGELQYAYHQYVGKHRPLIEYKNVPE